MILHKTIRCIVRYLPAVLIGIGIAIVLCSAGSSDYGIAGGLGEPAWTGWAAFGGLALVLIGTFISEARRHR